MFQVCETKCDQCLFSKDRIVSKERMVQLIEQCKKDDTHFTCHKASNAGRDVCCRGFYDQYDSQMIQIAQRLNMVEFVDPLTGKP